MELREQDLRIGNWYWWEAEGKKYPYQVEARDFSSNNIQNFEPIPLTEEWLLKFGFEKETEEEINTYEDSYGEKAQDVLWFKRSVVLMQSNYDKQFNHPIRMRHGNPREYKAAIGVIYVHQLQNLYYALTGEELTIKE